jgi:transposase
LARFVVEVVDELDLSELEKACRGTGSASYHPATLLSLLVYDYASKVFSSRALERATYDSVAFRFIAGNEHHDQDTIAAFRKRFLGQIESLFLVALDGTKVPPMRAGTVCCRTGMLRRSNSS